MARKSSKVTYSYNRDGRRVACVVPDSEPRRPLPGDTVRHFSNPACLAYVVQVRPPRPCGEWGEGNWLRGAFMSVAVLVLRFPDGHQVEEFASSWSVV